MRGLMMDQLIIGSIATNDDFGASIASRDIGVPEKKKIKKSVPFSNIVHDFSKINGEIYWDERIIEYVFEMMADSPEQLEEMKTEFSSFVMNVTDEEIHDPFIPDYHFKGSFDSMEYEDEEHELKTTVSVTFAVYPYKIANTKTGYPVSIPVSENRTIYVNNSSAHRITPEIAITGAVRIVYKNGSYAFADTVVNDPVFSLAVGSNEFYIENNSDAESSVYLSFRNEVF